MSRRRRQPQVYTCEHCGQNFGSRGGYQVHLNRPTCPVLKERAEAQAAETRETHQRRWKQRMLVNGGIAWEPVRAGE